MFVTPKVRMYKDDADQLQYSQFVAFAKMSEWPQGKTKLSIQAVDFVLSAGDKRW